MRILLRSSLILLLLIHFSLMYANENIELLKNKLTSEQNDSTKLELLNELSWEYRYMNPDSGIFYAKLAYEIAKQNNFTESKASALKQMGACYRFKNEFDTALFYYNKSLTISTALNDTYGISACYNNIGVVYDYLEHWDTAITYFSKSLELRRILNDSMAIALIYSNIGDLYRKQGNYSKALEQYDSAITIAEIIKDDYTLQSAYHNYGLIFEEQGNYVKALDFYFKSLKIEEKHENEMGIGLSLVAISNIYLLLDDITKAKENVDKALSIFEGTDQTMALAECYGAMGLVYSSSENYPESLNYYSKALALYQQFAGNTYIIDCYNSISRMHIEMGQYNSALDSINIAIKLAKATNTKTGLLNSMSCRGLIYNKLNKHDLAIQNALAAYQLAKDLKLLEALNESAKTLMNSYSALGNYQQAFHFSKVFNQTKDSLSNSKMIKQLARQELHYEHDKHQNELKIQQEKNSLLHKIELNKQKNIRNVIILSLVLILIVAVVIYREYILKKKINLELNEKNNHITASINYAKRIQNALLTPKETISRIIPDHFIVYKPLNVVSGDFYFIEEMNNKTVIAIADCTGHGVPGAFMSMLGISFLNEIIITSNTNNPAEILEKLREKVKTSLHQSGKIGETNDGMDIAICIIDKDKKQLDFAGAYHPLYIIQNNELHVHKANKQPISIYYKESPFNNKTIPIQQNDTIYLLTDGYTDQFSSDSVNKFSSSRFKALISNIHHEPMQKQKEIIEENLAIWKGNHDQIDDILILGFKI